MSELSNAAIFLPSKLASASTIMYENVSFKILNSLEIFGNVAVERDSPTEDSLSTKKSVSPIPEGHVLNNPLGLVNHSLVSQGRSTFLSAYYKISLVKHLTSRVFYKNNFLLATAEHTDPLKSILLKL